MGVTLDPVVPALEPVGLVIVRPAIRAVSVDFMQHLPDVPDKDMAGLNRELQSCLCFLQIADDFVGLVSDFRQPAPHLTVGIFEALMASCAASPFSAY